MGSACPNDDCTSNWKSVNSRLFSRGGAVACEFLSVFASFAERSSSGGTTAFGSGAAAGAVAGACDAADDCCADEDDAPAAELMAPSGFCGTP